MNFDQQTNNPSVWSAKNRSCESVYFYTFHKCASSLFGEYVLPNITGLSHVDYESLIYRDQTPAEISFKESGYVYGPIRISTPPGISIYDLFVKRATTPDFVHDKRAVFLIRDPRDILVSQYYSFGFTHGLSPSRQLRDRQESNRRQIQTKTLDEYVLEAAPAIRDHFHLAYELSIRCKDAVVLKYEDMINDFEHFARGLSQFFELSDQVREQIFSKTRPKAVEDLSSHRRSGKPGDFSAKLTDQTVKALNAILLPAVRRFNDGYSPAPG